MRDERIVMWKASRPTVATLQAMLVTVLWASSWVLIKLGLRASLPPLTFAGLRYVLAFLCLAPFVLLSLQNRTAVRSLTKTDWIRLALLGLLYYTVTQGSQFLSLAYLPAATGGLLLNLTPLVVAVPGMVLLDEYPSRRQWFGIALTILGVALYFLPLNARAAPVIGLLVALSGVVSNAASSLLGRHMNRLANSSPLIITFASMGIGSAALLMIGVIFQGLGKLDWHNGALIAWLALVNTAFAFTLWNHTLRTLSAVESSVINSLMMPQIAILAYVFLGETLSGREVLGLILVSLGVVTVQISRTKGRGQNGAAALSEAN